MQHSLWRLSFYFPCLFIVSDTASKLSETLSIDVGQVIVGVGLPFVRLELSYHLKAVMGVVAVVAL